MYDFGNNRDNWSLAKEKLEIKRRFSCEAHPKLYKFVKILALHVGFV
jgi:hypothetical protein